MKIFLTVLSSLALSCGLAQNVKQDAVATYADIVFASYEDSLTLAQDLKTAIDIFLAAPGEDTLAAAKDAWLAAREPYGQTEVYRF